MQLQGATKLELTLYNTCLEAEKELPASALATSIVSAMSEASNELQRLRAENERLRETSIVLCAKVEECVLSSNHCFGNHDYNCRWEIAYWHQANRDSIAQYEAAQDAGCNCGLSDEHDQVEAAVYAMREILKPQQEQGK